MMRWPWRREKRSFTGAYVDALLQSAAGVSGDVAATAAAETAAGLWGRAFSAAQLEPESRALEAVTPEVLQLIGRELILRGEAVLELRVRGGEMMLDPAADWTVYGSSPAPALWAYDLTLNGPSGGTVTRTVSADRVVHVRYASGPREPWRGISPIHGPSSSAALAAQLERRLSQEVSGTVGRLISIPDRHDPDDLDALASDLRGLDGGTLMVPTTAGAWSGAVADAPRSDWSAQRLGADPPAPLVDLRSRAALSVLAACGIPAALVDRSDGTSMREGWRQFLFGSVAPVGRVVGAELRRKLDSPGLRLTWPDLRASDLQGRARAYAGLVAAGMDPERAARLSGFDP